MNDVMCEDRSVLFLFRRSCAFAPSFILVSSFPDGLRSVLTVGKGKGSRVHELRF